MENWDYIALDHYCHCHLVHRWKTKRARELIAVDESLRWHVANLYNWDSVITERLLQIYIGAERPSPNCCLKQCTWPLVRLCDQFWVQSYSYSVCTSPLSVFQKKSENSKNPWKRLYLNSQSKYSNREVKFLSCVPDRTCYVKFGKLRLLSLFLTVFRHALQRKPLKIVKIRTL